MHGDHNNNNAWYRRYRYHVPGRGRQTGKAAVNPDAEINTVYHSIPVQCCVARRIDVCRAGTPTAACDRIIDSRSNASSVVKIDSPSRKTPKNYLINFVSLPIVLRGDCFVCGELPV